jgi:hypothetical protein
MTEGFWLFLTLGTLIWYVVLLAYVAVRGARDIREMLTEISAQSPEQKRE